MEKSEMIGKSISRRKTSDICFFKYPDIFFDFDLIDIIHRILRKPAQEMSDIFSDPVVPPFFLG
jgi:hypothetical protein